MPSWWKNTSPVVLWGTAFLALVLCGVAFLGHPPPSHAQGQAPSGVSQPSASTRIGAAQATTSTVPPGGYQPTAGVGYQPPPPASYGVPTTAVVPGYGPTYMYQSPYSGYLNG